MYITFTSLAFSLLIGQVNDPPDLTGGLKDDSYKLEWKSSASKQGQNPSWGIYHFLHNQKQSSHIRVKWLPDIYDAWLEYTKSPKRVVFHEGLSKQPQRREGKIVYGQQEKDHPARSYRDDEEVVGEETQELKSTISLTVKHGEQFYPLQIQCRTRLGRGGILYEVSVNPPPPERLFKIRWEAAFTPEFMAASIIKGGTALPLTGGKTVVIIPIKDSKVKVHSGPIFVTDKEGGNLGMAQTRVLIPVSPEGVFFDSPRSVEGKLHKFEESKIRVFVKSENKIREYHVPPNASVFFCEKDEKQPKTQSWRSSKGLDLDGRDAIILLQGNQVVSIAVNLIGEKDR